MRYDLFLIMHDPGYKRLFAQPRMVQDLLHGFAARDWSDALDFSTLTPVPASFVSDRLRERHGDLVWKVRFRDEWLYLLADDLPSRNLVSALIALETNRADERVAELLAALFERLRELETPELTQVFREWVKQVLVPRKLRGTALESLPGLEEVRPMLQEMVAGWVAEGREQGLKEGIEQGIEQGRGEERRRLCRQAARKFTPERRRGCPSCWSF